MTQIARSAEEIKARIEVVSQHLFDFQTGDLIPYLDFPEAQPFLNKDTTRQEFDQIRQPYIDKGPIGEALEYLPFAWEKANNCRGLSAMRSLDHLKAWLWLAGYNVDDDFDMRYEFYGKPCLITASELVGFDWRAADNGNWVNDEDGPRLSEDRKEPRIQTAIQAAETHKASNPQILEPQA